jgi:hypothetical protein
LDSGDSSPSKQTDDEAPIPAPFDELPTRADPSEGERGLAQSRFPPEAVPDTGPIPDPNHQHTAEREIVVPEWAVEAARWHLQRLLDRRGDDSPDTPAELPAWRVEETLMGYAQLRERFVMPDGRDAGDVVLAGLDEGDHAE